MAYSDPVPSASHENRAPAVSDGSGERPSSGRSYDEILLALVREFAEELGLRQSVLANLSLDTRLSRDLGLDSLARVELFSRIERTFQMELPEEAFAEVDSLRDALGHVKAGRPAPEHRDLTEEPVLPTPEAIEPVPADAQTLIQVLEWHRDKNPDRPHVQLYREATQESPVTFGELYDAACRYAAGLQVKGLEPGDRMALMLPTGRSYFFAFFGTLLAGGVPVPIYPPTRPSQLGDHLRRHSRILANCEAKGIIAEGEAKRLAQMLKGETPLRMIITPGDLLEMDARFSPVPREGDDLAFIQYTSGSTGQPKGVALSHANILANLRAMGDATEASSKDVFVSWLPLYHDMGLIGAWFGSLYFGCLTVIMPPTAFLSRPLRWLRAIQRYRGTLTTAPNFGYELCTRRLEDSDLEGLDLSSLRVAFNGAEPVSPATIERFCERFAPYGFRRKAMSPVYGLAENTVGLTFPPLDRGPVIDAVDRDVFQRSRKAAPAASGDPNPLRFPSSGRVIPGHEIRIVDGAGYELGERVEGHLEFRGPSTMHGYFHNPEENARVFHDSWVRSGDMAYLAGGEIYVTGRSKDIIIRGGRNLYPQEIEERVGEISGIRKGCVAAFAAEDPHTGSERLVVVAETREEDTQTRERLREAVNDAVTELVGGPADTVVLGSPHTVLKTSSGKIRRRATRDLYEKGWLGRRSPGVWRQLVTFQAQSWGRRLAHKAAQWGAYLSSCFAWLTIALVGLAVIPVYLLLPRLSWRWWVARGALRFLFAVNGVKRHIDGLENLRGEDSVDVVVANHSSYVDVFVLMAELPHPVAFVAKAELATNAWTRLLLNRLGVQYVERVDKAKGLEDARRIAEKARSGISLLFFPEGTFDKTPGLLPFHLGAFATAAQERLPVVPIAIRGSRNVLPADSWFFRRSEITIVIGTALTDAVDRNESEWNRAIALRNQSRDFILEHCGVPDRGGERAPAERGG